MSEPSEAPAESPETPAERVEAVAVSRPARRFDVAWVISSYFAEGFPYTVVNNIAEILFKELGASLQVIGLTSLFHLPWNLKFLWAPFIDRYETKRRWLIGVEVALTLVMVVLAAVGQSAGALTLIAALFMLMGVLSATHDIAIDGFYLEALDEAGQSRYVGYRAMAYKVASLVVRGAVPILAGLLGWTMGLAAVAVMMGGITVLHLLILPRVELRHNPLRDLLRALVSFPLLALGALLAAGVLVVRLQRWPSELWRAFVAAVKRVPLLGSLSLSGWIGVLLLLSLLLLLPARKLLLRQRDGAPSGYAAAFIDFLDKPRVGLILAFVVLFRTGESFLMKMKWPFLQDQMQMTLPQYGFFSGTLGVVASFTATLLGGWLIARQGLRRWIWPFVIAQNVLNLLYAGLASLDAPASLVTLGLVISAEHFGEGLGTAVFMVYLMRCCDPAHKASHMAILTALMSLSFTIAGVFSGFIAEAIGYQHYFAFSFVATIPAMVLILFVPHLERDTAAAKTAA